MEKPDIKIIIGKTGSGKTVKVRNLIKPYSRILIFDTKGYEYKDGVVVESIPQLNQFWAKVYRGHFRIIYRPLDLIDEFDQVCDLVFKCGNMTFVVEELDIFAQPQKTPISFQNVLRRGRSKDITFIGVTQRPYGIDRSITSQASEAYIFKTDEPRDIQYLIDRFGAGVEVKIAGLQQYEYVKKVDHSTEYEIGKDEL